MDRDKLKQHLISDTTRLFCILDGASVPKLPMQLHKMQAANVCLFKGDLEPDMLYVAPFVVHLPPNDKFTDWVLSESFGKHWGIFVHTRRSMQEMRRHFRSLINVYDEEARSLVFRFYDPRVLNKFLPTCDAGQLKSFFGDIDAFYAENGSKLVRYGLDKGKLVKRDLD